MIDLTKITTPFGLLDEETKAALKAHGGPYQVFYSTSSESRWCDHGLNTKHFVDYLVHRVKPLTKPSIDWSHVHPNYNWLAQDSDGGAWVFANKPTQKSGYWVCLSNKGGDNNRVNAFMSYAPGTCDWKDSLVERP